MTGKIDLTQEQQDALQSALSQYNLSHTSSAEQKEAIAHAKASGNLAEAMRLEVKSQKQELEDKSRICEGILAPDQLQAYKQYKQDMIDMGTSAMKMFLSQSTNSNAQ